MINAVKIILEEDALVGGPSPSSPPVCIDCLNPWTGPYLCPDCGWPLCENCGQGPHQLECPVLSRCPQNLRPVFLPPPPPTGTNTTPPPPTNTNTSPPAPPSTN